MNVEQIIENLNNKFPSNRSVIKELDNFLLETEFYDFDTIKNDIVGRVFYIKSEFFERRKGCSKIYKCLADMIKNSLPGNNKKKYHRHKTAKPSQSKLYKKERNYTKALSFRECTRFHRTENVGIMKKTFPANRFKQLLHLEAISMSSKLPISEALVTGYHQSGLRFREYYEQCDLLEQMKQISNTSNAYNRRPTRTDESFKHLELLKNYLYHYEKTFKPLPLNHNLVQNTIYDDINTHLKYMVEINNSLQSLKLMNRYPAQLDTYIIPPNAKLPNCDLDNLRLNGTRIIKSDSNSRRCCVDDGVGDVFRLLRDASQQLLNQANGQRIVMLIVRKNIGHTKDDLIYIFKPLIKNTLPASPMADYCELKWILNTRGEIIPGLSSNKHGILAISHHLHSAECNKIYIHYEQFASRVFKHDIVAKLPVLFSGHGVSQINQETFALFDSDYKEYVDVQYHEFSKYYFAVKRYEIREPYWFVSNARAMSNVYIPKSSPACTDDLNNYIDDPFQSVAKLYYKIDYTVAMQVMDKQHRFYVFSGGDGICVINTELKKNGETLYAIIVENPYKSKQRWKITDYQHISEAFMTAAQLYETYGIFGADLPVGSKAKHDQFLDKIGEINVTEQVIKKTKWHNIRIIQSQRQSKEVKQYQQNGSSQRTNYKSVDNRYGATKLSEYNLRKYAIEALRKYGNINLVPIMSFKFRKNKYYVEKLLPIKLPNNKYIAISFKFNEAAGKTQTSAICLDLCDMYNKASLVFNINKNNELHQWLTANNNENSMSINNLVITHRDRRNHESEEMSTDEEKIEMKQVDRAEIMANDDALSSVNTVPPILSSSAYNTPSLLPQQPTLTASSSLTLPPATMLNLSLPQTPLTSMPSLDSLNMNNAPFQQQIFVPSKVSSVPVYRHPSTSAAAVPSSYNPQQQQPQQQTNVNVNVNHHHMLSMQSPMIRPVNNGYQPYIPLAPLQLQSMYSHYTNNSVTPRTQYFAPTTPTVTAMNNTLPPLQQQSLQSVPVTAVSCHQPSLLLSVPQHLINNNTQYYPPQQPQQYQQQQMM